MWWANWHANEHARTRCQTCHRDHDVPGLKVIDGNRVMVGQRTFQRDGGGWVELTPQTETRATEETP